MMTNDELQKKIVEILEETEHEWTEDKNGYILQIFYSKLADALIAAGLTFEPIIIHTFERAACSCPEMVALEDMHKEDQEYIDALLHRAKVAERALEIAVNEAYDYTYEEAIAKAKKELEEEKEDD